MLNKIINYAIHNRLVIITVTILLVAGGSYITSKSDLDVFPDLTAPTVVVLTESHGMAPEEVEKLVTFPIETAVNGATGVRRVRSSSSMGFSIVNVEFDWGTDIYRARQTVSEKLATIQDQLPSGVDNPVLAPQSSIMGEIMIIALTAKETSPMELNTLAEWTVRPRILALGGVAQVSIIGGESKQYQVHVDPHKLKYYGVSYDQVLSACQSINENVSGGFFNQYGNEYIVRGIIRTHKVEDIENALIEQRGDYAVRVRDIARVKVGAAPAIGTGSHDGEEAVIMTITKQPDVNTLKLSNRIHDEFKILNETLPDDVEIHTDIFDQARFIETAVNNVMRAMTEGGLFVVIILFLFLMNGRTTIISLTAIPLSLLVTFIILYLFGLTINTMSLGGMAIAIGSVVDDAIIDVENVYKRLRQNVALPKQDRQPVLKVIYNASVEIRASIMNATLIIIVAFLPLFFLSGMEGRMLKPLGIAYIVALLASLIIAITLTPVMCSLLLTNEKRLKKHAHGSWVERNMNRLYLSSLQKVLKKPAFALTLTSVLFAGAIVLLFTFGRSFLPPFNEGALTINTATIPGISLEKSDELGREVETRLLKIPEIQATARRTGRAELAEHSFGVNVSEIDAPISFSGRSKEEVVADVRHELSGIQGIIFEVGQPVSHRIDAMLSGTEANIAIKVFGTELKTMYDIATDIRNLIVDIEGIADVNVEQQVEIPQLQIRPKRQMLTRFGISMKEFGHFIDAAIGGAKVSDVYEGERLFELIVRYDKPDRGSIEAIRNTLIEAGTGEKIPLHFVADVKSDFGPNTISRENVKRKIVVSANIAGSDLRTIVNEIQKRVKENIDFPENYYASYGGQFESESKASKTLMITSFLAILIIFMLLYQEFKNGVLSGLILLNLPLALIGGVFAVWFSSSVLSIPAIIGFITLFGIATRNGILLVSRFIQLKKENKSLDEQILIGAGERLNPIIMTALTAALALFPLALASGKPGNEIQGPMAIVILGGLLSSTLLNIYVITLVYRLLERKNQNDEK
ncbi:MAG: CusA/CzcA family heavy metal efflux RND transporter [Salinivirgaceae bacterium]|nr:MAG: CusA/CzcA family heavy metal efflux RND transporter [Salinivirgaceae bacterium]